MGKDNVVMFGPRKYGLSSAIEQLPAEVVDELKLLRSKHEFGRLPLQHCLAYHEWVAQRLGELTAPLWSDPRTQFLVVCGEAVFASREPLVQFDQVGFEQAMQHVPTVIAPPEPEAYLAPVVELPRR